MSEQKEDPKVTVSEKEKKTFTEELEVTGGQLIDRIQEVVKEGNVRRIVIRSADDRVILETSLTVGVGVGGVLMLTPAGLPLAVLAVIAAAVARVKIEIVREVTGDEHTIVEGKKKKIDIDDSE